MRNETRPIVLHSPAGATAPEVLLALDPGIKCSGVALFQSGRLLVAGCVMRYDYQASTAGAASVMAQLVDGLYVKLAGEHKLPDRPHCLAVEWPQIYDSRKRATKADPNDMLGLAGVCAGAAALLLPGEVRAVTPREWKGTLDGDAMTARIEERLRESGELDRVVEARVTYRHNAVDAAGIGLHALGRLKRRRAIVR